MTIAIDLNKEVQDFGLYKLVIRQTRDVKVSAVLWRAGEKLALAEASTREEAYDEILRLLGIKQMEKAKEHASLSGFLCARHSMTKRSMNATQDEDRYGGPSGAAADSG